MNKENTSFFATVNEQNVHIFKQEAGLISEKDCWVCIHDSYLYIHDSVPQLIKLMEREWESEKHLVG